MKAESARAYTSMLAEIRSLFYSWSDLYTYDNLGERLDVSDSKRHYGIIG